MIPHSVSGGFSRSEINVCSNLLSENDDALGFHGAEFLRMHPSLQRGITDTEHFCGIPKLYRFSVVAQESNSSSEKKAASHPS
jgi:hypothetical protein